MIPLADIERAVDIFLEQGNSSRFSEENSVYVPFMRQSGIVKRVTGKQIDIMLSNGTFIQTHDRQVEFAENTTIKEESNQFPLKECSNYSQKQSSLSENNDKTKTKQLSLF